MQLREDPPNMNELSECMRSYFRVAGRKGEKIDGLPKAGHTG